MRRHLISSVAAVAATGSLGLFAASALADGSPGASAPSSATAVTQTTAVTTTAPVTTSATVTSATTTATKPKPTKPKSTPTPAAAAKLTLSAPGVYVVQKNKAVLQGSYLKVTGSVSRYVPGQFVKVAESLNKKVFHREKLAIKPTARGTGTFTATIKAKAAGILRVEATHGATPQLNRFSQITAITAMSTNVQLGSTGLFVALVQQKLAALHVYIPQTGVWDSGTQWAISAYHRLLNRGYSTTLDPATLTDLLAGKGSFTVRYPHQGRHVEGDLGKQLAALIDGSKVYWIFPISSGKPSTPTILGSFQIYSRVPGYLPDGMYYSDFFIRGYALHGYDPSPNYPASHGCMRLPIQDAIAAFNWLQLGDWVDVYRDSGNYSGTV
jgi:L,D-transpeptidase catalytic domain